MSGTQTKNFPADLRRSVDSAFAVDRQIFGRRKLLTITAVFMGTFIAMGTSRGLGNSDSTRVLTPERLQAIAWPEGRRHFNSKLASQAFGKEITSEVKPLLPNAFTRPTRIQKKSNITQVVYGGRPTGVSISVFLNEAGEIVKIKSSYSNW